MSYRYKCQVSGVDESDSERVNNDETSSLPPASSSSLFESIYEYTTPTLTVPGAYAVVNEIHGASFAVNGIHGASYAVNGIHASDDVERQGRTGQSPATSATLTTSTNNVGSEDAGIVADYHVVPEATLVIEDEEEDQVVYVATPTPKWYQQRQTKFMFGGFFLFLVALSIALGVGFTRPGVSFLNNSTVANFTNVVCNDNGTLCLLGDWAPCVSSDECDTNCCSGEYSGGVLACTPLDETLLLGGYQPDICEGESKSPWARCASSTGCDDNSGCCSGHFTGGNLSCTPITIPEDGEPAPLLHICISPETNCTDENFCLGGWIECSSGSECDSGCCSGTLSGGVQKCVPRDAPGFFPEICLTPGSSPQVPIPPKPAPVVPFTVCNGTECIGDWMECS
jgi:hypothetical protein